MSTLRLTTYDEQAYWQDLLDACTEYAENALDTSLLLRTITATYYRNDPVPLGWVGYDNYTPHSIHLPRGPVQSVTSVTDANSNTITYELERSGLTDKVILTEGYTAPLVIVYQAGYGSTVNNTPADIRMAIRTHVATLFEQRASTDEKNILAVPHSLEIFYQQRKRKAYVG